MKYHMIKYDIIEYDMYIAARMFRMKAMTIVFVSLTVQVLG